MQTKDRTFWITGDRHGDFSDLDGFMKRCRPGPSDVLIVLGDAGINYYGGARDEQLKQQLAAYPLTFFCIHGNHEARPETCAGYELRNGFGGRGWTDPRYPNQFFPVDGAVYDLGGLRTLVVGGAYSADKARRLKMGWHWFADEQPSEDIRRRTETALEQEDWTVDAVLSHTCPLSCRPFKKRAPLGSGAVEYDYSTEEWLDTLHARLSAPFWYAGHYHTNRDYCGITFLFDEYRTFGQPRNTVF